MDTATQLDQYAQAPTASEPRQCRALYSRKEKSPRLSPIRMLKSVPSWLSNLLKEKSTLL